MERPKRRPLPGSAASDLSATTSIKTVGRIMPLETPDDLPARWRGTPLEEFVAAHNFKGNIESCTNPRMLLVSCIEFRFRPIIPSGFSYVMRTAGGRLSNLNGAEFALSYVLSKGQTHRPGRSQRLWNDKDRRDETRTNSSFSRSGLGALQSIRFYRKEHGTVLFHRRNRLFEKRVHDVERRV